MILRNLAVVCLGIVWFQGVCGVSYSQVYVNNGLNGYQLPTLTYGAPGTTSLTSQQIQQGDPPIGSTVPYPQPASFAPCVIPLCVPNQVYGQPSYTPVEKARIVYNTPNSAVLLAPNTPTGYEYSYVVYDDSTGAQKFQRQWSNVPVVQGPYSYPKPATTYGEQPPLQYTAEDLKGFNAVIKSYLPSAFPSLFPNYKPIVLIQTEPCVDPPYAPSENGTKNDTTNEAEPVAKNKQPTKKGGKLSPKSFGVEDFEEDPTIEEKEITTTTSTTTTTTEKPATESNPSTTEEKVTTTEEKVTNPEVKETTTTELPKTENKPSEGKTKPKVELEVSEPAVAASDAYANVIRCIHKSMKYSGQGGANPLTYIISPFTPC